MNASPQNEETVELINIFWFRRDLRLYDNAALHESLISGRPVLPVYIFDPFILDQLEDKDDSRISFIYDTLKHINNMLALHGSSVCVAHGSPEEVFSLLLQKYRVEKVFANNEYEPYTRDRDEKIRTLLQKAGTGFITLKDHVIFEKNEISKDDGLPYTVFSPFARKWKKMLDRKSLQGYPSEEMATRFLKTGVIEMPAMATIGFERGKLHIPTSEIPDTVFTRYEERRNHPALEGTSGLGIHLRYGTVSIREVAARALTLSERYLDELIWRDFYQAILWNFPWVGKGRCFKKDYELIEWRNNEAEFGRWCNGITGYPIVDAGMRQLNSTGLMHNRVRMITASFLVKHLLIDWRWGEAYFAQKLLDYDLASNNGGWQWVTGSGCDAAPYFRVFNPAIQQKKFDPKMIYVKKWIPEFGSKDYPAPMVDHEFARKRCLDVYARALKKNYE